MAERTPLSARVLARAVGEVQRAQRGLGHVQSALFGFVQTALDDEQRAALTPLLYDRSPHGLGTDLFAWERPLFGAHLPRPPARVLVPACGAGREAHALARDGYEVDAFDPAQGLLRLLARRNDPACPVRAAAGRFRDLAAAGQGQGALAAFLRPPYDAVLFGWSALAHVLRADERAAIVDAAHQLCPAGPLIVTYPAPPLGGAKPRAMLLGEALGRRLARRDAHTDERVYFLPWAGFLAALDDGEPARWAARTGRTLRRIDDDTGPVRVILRP